jgi:hypothetical protein
VALSVSKVNLLLGERFLFDLRLGPNFLVLRVSCTLILGAAFGERGKLFVNVLFKVLAVVAKIAGLAEGL